MLLLALFSTWPTWQQRLVYAPLGIPAYVLLFLWTPKSEKGWRTFGLALAASLAYLALVYVIAGFRLP